MRVSLRDFRRALLLYIRRTAADLLEALEVTDIMADLAARCEDDRLKASGQLLDCIVAGSAEGAMHTDAREFNCRAEQFYREGLRREHLREGLAHLRDDLAELERDERPEIRGHLRHGVRLQDPARILRDIEPRLLSDDLSLHELSALLNLIVLLTLRDRTGAPA
jgi:hypothetical protein